MPDAAVAINSSCEEPLDEVDSVVTSGPSSLIEAIGKQILGSKHERHRHDQRGKQLAPNPAQPDVNFDLVAIVSQSDSIFAERLGDRREIDPPELADFGRAVHAETAVQLTIFAAGADAIVAQRRGRRDRELALPGVSDCRTALEPGICST